MNQNKTFSATSILIGTIIGAGFLGIPFVVMKSGFKIGLFHLIFIAALVGLTTLYLGEIALRTKENHHLPGYAEKYLGRLGKKLMFFAIAFGVYSAIIAYLIAEGESISQLLFNTTSYGLQISILFWILLSAITYQGIKALKEGESLGFILILTLVIIISVYLSNKIDIRNFTYTNWENFMLPFGIILFSFLGFTSIPEVKAVLGENKRPMKKVIISAYVISLIIYALFTFFVIGYKGLSTPEIATIALGKPFIFLSMITIFMSYMALSTAMIDMFKFDFKKTKMKAWLYTITIPIVVLLLLQIFNKADFAKIIGIGGVISGGLTAILIILMSQNAKLQGNRRPEYSMPHSKIINIILISIFVLGAIYEIIHLFN